MSTITHRADAKASGISRESPKDRVQDVIIPPSLETRIAVIRLNEEYGTTLRIYNPGTHVWDIAYCFTGKTCGSKPRAEVT